MKKKEVIIGAFIVISIALIVAFPIVFGFLAILGVVFLLINKKVLDSSWWKVQVRNATDFMPQPFFRNDYRRNFEMINLGSISASYDFSYGEVYGLNLSSGFQSLNIDLQILKFYHSYLKSGGLVALTLSPLADKHKEDFRYMARFYRNIPIEDRALYGDYYRPTVELLDSSGYGNRRLIRLYRKCPLLFGVPKIVRCCNDNSKSGGVNKLCLKQLRESLSENEANLLNQIVLFCKDREYRPFLVIPPLQSPFNRDPKTGIFVKQVKDRWSNQLPILDYSSNLDWTLDGNFDLPNCLKKEVAERFTVAVFKDITTIYEKFKVK